LDKEGGKVAEVTLGEREECRVREVVRVEVLEQGGEGRDKA
jgi:hypothetical protein